MNRRQVTSGTAAATPAVVLRDCRRRIDAIDRLVRALDERREKLGLSKAELARPAELAPVAMRRLFSVDSPNPAIGTLTALADALGLELVSVEDRVRLNAKRYRLADRCVGSSRSRPIVSS